MSTRPDPRRMASGSEFSPGVTIHETEVPFSSRISSRSLGWVASSACSARTRAQIVAGICARSSTLTVTSTSQCVGSAGAAGEGLRRIVKTGGP